MYAYVVENRRKNWYTGAKHIKKTTVFNMSA